MNEQRCENCRYWFWRAPTNGLPELTSGGHGVTVIPGLDQWVLLHQSVREIPADAVPAIEVCAFLEQWQPKEQKTDE